MRDWRQCGRRNAGRAVQRRHHLVTTEPMWHLGGLSGATGPSAETPRAPAQPPPAAASPLAPCPLACLRVCTTLPPPPATHSGVVVVVVVRTGASFVRFLFLLLRPEDFTREGAAGLAWATWPPTSWYDILDATCRLEGGGDGEVTERSNTGPDTQARATARWGFGPAHPHPA
jgi:hypothetical protein